MLGGIFGWVGSFFGYIVAFLLGVNWPLHF